MRSAAAVVVVIILVGLGVGLGAHAIRVRQFESGPVPVLQLVTNVEIGGASDNGEYFGCSVDRKVKGYTLGRACIWSQNGHITNLPTDGLFTSSVGWVSDDGKRAVGMSNLEDVPIDDPNKPTSYICEWSPNGTKKTAEPDFGTALARDGNWIAYNTFYPPAKGSNFEFGDSKTVEVTSLHEPKPTPVSSLRGAKVDAISNGGHILAGSIDLTVKSSLPAGADPKMADYDEMFADHHTKAAVWVDGRMTQITDLDSWATACSPDGTWVVGICSPYGADDQRGFRWSRETGFEILPGLSGRNLKADGVTADGKTVILDSDYRAPGQEHADMFQEVPHDGKPHLDPLEKIFRNEAFIWHEGVGTIPLRDYLVKRGAKIGKDEVFSFPHFISGDGHIVVCSKTQGWSVREGSWIIHI